MLRNTRRFARAKVILQWQACASFFAKAADTTVMLVIDVTKRDRRKARSNLLPVVVRFLERKLTTRPLYLYHPTNPVVDIFLRNAPANFTEYLSERPEMTSHGGKPRKAKNNERKLSYEK